jgi:membrane associated rhomboid family serine protease
MLLILGFLIVSGFVVSRMTPEERESLLRAGLAAIVRLKNASSQGLQECEPFKDALRARTPWALVTPALIALNVTIFVFMLFGAGALGDPQTLVGWGGSFGPRTTNGEWWRLVTSMFVHPGMLQLLVNVGGLVSIGFILERLVGRLAFAAVYVAAGVLASLVSLSIHPMAVSAGASGAIFGLYGLLLASSIWAMLHRSSVTIPLMAVKRLAPAAVVFILYNVANDGLGSAAKLTGLVAGFVYGLALTTRVNVGKPPARHLAAAMAATLAIAVASAVALHGITDVRPEMARVVAVEDSTASAYRTAVERFKKGRISAEALALTIDRAIVPELQAAGTRLKALERVPQEQRPLVAAAQEYVRLRFESWRIRAEGLRKTDMLAHRADEKGEQPSSERWRAGAEARHRANLLLLGKAEEAELASLEALQRIRPAGQADQSHADQK